MNTYIFDFGHDATDEVTLCVEVQAESEAGAVDALRAYLDQNPRSDGPYIVPAYDPAGKVQEFRFYFDRAGEDITTAHIADGFDGED